MHIALTRAVPDSIARCELTHLERTLIDPGRAASQHDHYEAALRTLGCTVERLPPAPDLPDSVFVEDIAIVLDELAIVTRPGAASRRREVPPVAAALRLYRSVAAMTAPATLDGGDVLRLGRSLYVGMSSRTNRAGVSQLARLAEPFGYRVTAMSVRGCLHLKSAVTALDDDCLICNPDWIDPTGFLGAQIVAVHADEPYAANVLRIDDAVICAAAYERTAADLVRRGYAVHRVDVSELARAEAGVTCCSLVFRK